MGFFKKRAPKAKRPVAPSLLRQLLTIRYEQALTHKALRQCVNQEWSVEFLTAMLIRAANVMNRPLEMTITNRNGTSIIVRSIDVDTSTFRDDSIFNHLDNEARVQEFLRTVNG